MINHTKTSSKIGRNLRKIRLQKGLMQVDVAVATDLNRTYISRIETGKARVTFALLCRLVKRLEITSEDLIEDEALAFARYIVLQKNEIEEGGNHG